MKIDWFQLSFALLLLWFPRQWLRLGGKVFRLRKRRSRRALSDPSKTREPGDQSLSFIGEMKNDRNYIDFFRAAVGGIALVGGMDLILPSIQFVAIPDEEATNVISFIFLGIALIGVLVQTLRYEGRFSLFPAVFYLAGLSIALCGLKAGFFALGLVWVINLALPNPVAFLTVHALLIAIFGILFVGMEQPLPFFAAALTFLPALLSLLLRRSLVTFSKKFKAAAV